MASKKENTEAYVWIWLPGATEPVVAGKLEAQGAHRTTKSQKHPYKLPI